MTDEGDHTLPESGGVQTLAYLVMCARLSEHASSNSPISRAGLFGGAVVDSAQQFSAAPKQTEAFKTFSDPAASCCPCRRLRCLSLLAAERALLRLPPPPARPQQQPFPGRAVRWSQEGAPVCSGPAAR